MKLHLGCGHVRLPEPWINIDRRYHPATDEIDNIGILQHQKENSVDEIYCCHALDHFDRWHYKTVLRRWFDILNPGGTLRMSVPDWAAAWARYQITNKLEPLIGHLYAGQNYEDNVRHWIWDFSMATRDLEEIGFQHVDRFDAVKWWTGDLLPLGAKGSDCSTLYWDMPDGVRIQRSLNVTARKPDEKHNE
jgi:hypothetical protein